MPAIFKSKTYVKVIKPWSVFNFSFPNFHFHVLIKDWRMSVHMEGSWWKLTDPLCLAESYTFLLHVFASHIPKTWWWRSEYMDWDVLDTCSSKGCFELRKSGHSVHHWSLHWPLHLTTAWSSHCIWFHPSQIKKVHLGCKQKICDQQKTLYPSSQSRNPLTSTSNGVMLIVDTS